jgi:hypothetical protein
LRSELGRTLKHLVYESEHREANIRLLVAAVVSLVVLIAFSFVVLRWYDPRAWPNEKFWDWSISAMGTLFSFILGLAVGALHLNRQMAVTQRGRKENLRDLLIVELTETLHGLDDMHKTLDVSNNNNRQPTLTYIHPLVLEEAVKSGLFAHELTKDMLRLTKMYHKYNDHVTTLRAAGKPPESAVESTKKLASHIMECTNKILPVLNNPPSPQ